MYERVSDLAYFRSLVAEADQIPLLEAAASLAQDEYPGLDLQQVLSDVDTLAKRLADRCRDASTEMARLQVTLTFFFKELAFAGNVNDYYDPANSFIHKVLETRRGIPISLTVLFMELARTVGLESHGLSFPGHFLVSVQLHEGAVVLDPFTGQSLSREDISERLEPVREGFRERGATVPPLELFLQAAPANEILMRMLRNLHEIYRQQGETEKIERIQARMKILQGADEPV
ncbi:MAG: transglutaminase-like domain-containing protein [Burkholderiaceae bacterium]